ncbi:hypothetical protein [Ruminococcus flavefaciens]|uniref:hypothetical protein n=1 Tax=Ruminococcus flavefaciens TaxID=1265 RepID=UPI00031883F1|nr:hypothetical protein [Ruminococcus flavefaciens]
MITASQVFAVAPNGDMRDVRQKDSNMLCIVPDEKESTCMQGMATDGTYIYVAKIKTDDSNVRIIRYNLNNGARTVLKNKNGSDFCSSGHAGDMTAVLYKGDTYLFILNKVGGGSKIDKYIINQSRQTIEKCGTYKLNVELGGIAAEAFQNRNLNVDRYCNFYFKTGGKVYNAVLDMQANNQSITLNDSNVIVGDWKRVWKCNDTEKRDKLAACKSQGIGFYGSNSCKILYMVYSNKTGENFIIEYDLNSKDKENRVFNAHEVTIAGKCRDKFELESCVVIGTSTYYNTECKKDGINYDGIYRYFK